jgi:hypothetical protein
MCIKEIMKIMMTDGTTVRLPIRGTDLLPNTTTVTMIAAGITEETTTGISLSVRAKRSGIHGTR